MKNSLHHTFDCHLKILSGNDVTLIPFKISQILENIRIYLYNTDQNAIVCQMYLSIKLQECIKNSR